MKPLLPVLRAERDCLDELVTAMHAEREAIAASRFHDLPALTAHKEQVLARLAELDAQREAAEAAGAAATGSGAAAGAQQDLLDTWREVLDRAESAARANRELAAVVYTQIQFTSDALAVLQAGNQPLYGSNGFRPQNIAHTRLGAG